MGKLFRGRCYLTTDGADGDTTGWLDRVDPVNVSPPDTSTSNTTTLGLSAGAPVVLTENNTGTALYEIKSDQNYGQTFTVSGSGTYTVGAIHLNMSRVSSPANQTLTLTIRTAWNSGILATVIIPTGNITTGGNDVAIEIPGGLTLNYGTQYFLRVTSNSTSGGYYWRGSSSDVYSGGTQIKPDGTTDTKDMRFRVVSGVIVDAVTSDQSNGTVSTRAISHTTGSGDNRLMLVGVGIYRDESSNRHISAITYAGQSLTKYAERNNTDGTVRTEIWYLVNPPSGTANVVINTSGSSARLITGIATFVGVDQTSPLGTAQTFGANSGNPTVTVTSETGGLVFDVTARDNNGSWTPGAGQFERWDLSNGSDLTGAGSTEAGLASVVMSWTSDDNSQQISQAAVPIRPATTGGGTTAATFVQTPVMASDLELPAGAAINVINFVNVVSGTMPANPSITAKLKYGTTTFATLTNPIYNSGTGTLTWTTTLAGNVTIPAGQSVVLEVTTAQSGVSFQIEYDSNTKPSRIELPATTYINVDSLAVYDAPFTDDGIANDGNVVTSAFSGATVYVRAVVSDPFGKDDITSLTMDINPIVGSVSPMRYDVNTAANQVVYEYAWFTGANQGMFDITVVAHEGYEGDVFDTAATQFSVTFQDSVHHGEQRPGDGHLCTRRYRLRPSHGYRSESGSPRRRDGHRRDHDIDRRQLHHHPHRNRH
jgi:hypothetical protein